MRMLEKEGKKKGEGRSMCCSSNRCLIVICQSSNIKTSSPLPSIVSQTDPTVIKQ